MDDKPPSKTSICTHSGLEKLRFELRVGHISSIASPETPFSMFYILYSKLPCSTKLQNFLSKFASRLSCYENLVARVDILSSFF